MTLSGNQTNNDTTLIEILDLHPNEMWLIKTIRKNLRFGDMTIRVREGIPYEIRRITDILHPGES